MSMTTQTKLNPSDATTAGALYLSIAVFGAFSIGYVPTQIVDIADAVASTDNLLNKQGLFRLGILADSAVILMEIVITAILFQMFKNSNPRLAMIAMLSRFGMIVVMGLNLLIWILPNIILDQTLAQNGFDGPAVVQMFFHAHAMGVFVWQLFFGAHLLALGAIILRSTSVPHVLGWGLFIGAFGYLVQGLVELTFTDVAALDITVIGLLVIVTLSEVGFGLWLLVSGLRNRA